MKRIQIFFAIVLLITSCSANYPGAMDTPKPVTEVIEVKDMNGSVKLTNGIYDLVIYRYADILLSLAECAEYANDRITAANGSGASYYKVDSVHNRYPIPQAFIDESKNVIAQNPGY